MPFLKGYRPWNKDGTCSEETKLKMSKTRKGRKLKPLSEEHKRKISESKKGIIAGMKGKHHAEESKRKNALAHLGKIPWNKGRVGVYSKDTLKKMSGKNNHGWKGGVSDWRQKIYNSQEYKIWRRAVFERDDYTCVWCGEKGGILNADHIKPFSMFPELRFAIDNGRTLCINCHRKTDTYGGRMKTFTSKQ